MSSFTLKSKQFARSCLLLTLVPVILFAGVTNNLPDFGDSAGSVVSPEYDRRLGQLFMKEVRRYAKVINDPEVQSYIQSLGYQLALHSDGADQSFSFFVIDNPTINAFAGPGGKIGMHSGVILNSENESELAAVMAHEISHVTQRHLARTFERASKFSLPQAAALIGAILVGIANPEAGAAALTGITGLAAQSQINFTRANEEEADRVGMQVLAKAGYNPRSMPTFFEKLQRLSRYSQSTAPEFLRTHPLTTSRIADSRARAESYPQQVYKDTLSYELIKNKLFVGSMKSATDAATVLRQELTHQQISEDEKLGIYYGLAYAYITGREFPRAEQQIDILLSHNPDHIAFLLLAAKLETEQSNYGQALAIYKKSYKLYPDYKPLTMAYSRALLDVNRGEEARELLKNYERHHNHDLATYSLLGQAEAMLGDDIETAILQAEYYFLAGETKLAIDKLTFVKQQYKLNYYQRQRVDARMTELQYELELEEDLNL